MVDEALIESESFYSCCFEIACGRPYERLEEQARVGSVGACGAKFRAMFSALRIVVAVGVIFYLSPVREPLRRTGSAERAAPVRDAVGATLDEGSSDRHAASADNLLRALPAAAKQSLLDRLIAAATGSVVSASSDHAAGAAATDTLEPEDLKPTWRGAPQRPRP
jgi:hypothetical protein